jgi:hypothetical protein
LAVSHSATLPLSFAFNPFVAVASPANHFVPLQSFAPAFTATQYHAQDEFGQASFGYAHPGQAATNFRDAFGNQVGSYAYINPEGKEIRVSYVADSNGFRVLSNALPEGPAPLNVALPAPVQDTPEVMEARKAHMRALEAARSGEVAVPAFAVALPAPVQDTPEVAAAKVEHAKAWSAALAAAESSGSRKKRQVFAYGAPLAHPFGYSALPLAHSALPLAHSALPLAHFALPLAHSALPLAYSAHPYAVTPYAAVHALPAVPPTPVREATLSKTVHNPGHAVSYRVD